MNRPPQRWQAALLVFAILPVLVIVVNVRSEDREIPILRPDQVPNNPFQKSGSPARPDEAQTPTRQSASVVTAAAKPVPLPSVGRVEQTSNAVQNAFQPKSESPVQTAPATSSTGMPPILTAADYAKLLQPSRSQAPSLSTSGSPIPPAMGSTSFQPPPIVQPVRPQPTVSSPQQLPRVHSGSPNRLPPTRASKPIKVTNPFAATKPAETYDVPITKPATLAPQAAPVAPIAKKVHPPVNKSNGSTPSARPVVLAADRTPLAGTTNPPSEFRVQQADAPPRPNSAASLSPFDEPPAIPIPSKPRMIFSGPNTTISPAPHMPLTTSGPAGESKLFPTPAAESYFDQGAPSAVIQPEPVDYFGECGGCPRTRYGFVEAVYFNRTGGFTTISNGFGIGDFDYELGGRATIGRRDDCLDGWEVSYFGMHPWITVDRATSAGGNLFGQFAPAGGLNAAQLSAFNNATFHERLQRSELHSVELNRMWWGWDVMSSFIGLRYLMVDEEFRFSSANNIAQVGRYSIETTNHVFGPQIGGELIYDIGGRFYVSGKLKLGAFINFNEGSAQVVNAANLNLNNSDSDIGFSAMGEIGVNAYMRLGRRARLRVGYEAWYIYGLATIEEQMNGLITPLTGVALEDEDDVFYHGATVGIEFFR